MTGKTRREFLKTSAAAASALAFPTVVPSTVFGQNAPSNRIHLAGLGVGSRGNGVLAGFLQLPDQRILAVCDPYRDKRERTAAAVDQKSGGKICTPYADFREVLARDDIDAAVICSCDHWHVHLALHAVRAGLDVYVEKPLGVCLTWEKQLREEVQRYGRIFQYGTQQRSSSQFRHTCELVRNGYIGELEGIDVWSPDVSDDWNDFTVPRYGRTDEQPVPEGFEYDMWLGPAKRMPYNEDRCRREGSFHIYDYGLGFIAGWGAHPLDIAQWGNDADDTGPVYYEGQGEVPTEGLLDTVASWDVHCRYENGVKMHFMCHRVAEPIVKGYRRRWSGHGTTFFGSEGWISVDRGGIEASDHRIPAIKLADTDRRLYHSPRHDRNFLDCIKSRQRAVSDVGAAVRSNTISHLSEQCVRLGRPVRWDPQREQAIGDAQLNRLLSRPTRGPWHV
ncbi:MAG: Gfo/Idh/MocA family protein [Phycisphaerales bacterium JB038]